MQWDDTASAVFTTGTPWIKVGPDYETVNAKNEMADPDSVYNYYKKLIHLRKEKDIMVYGTYELLDPEDEALYVYTRTLGDQKLLVMCNFTIGAGVHSSGNLCGSRCTDQQLSTERRSSGGKKTACV